jgi:protein-disulfide isomerase
MFRTLILSLALVVGCNPQPSEGGSKAKATPAATTHATPTAASAGMADPVASVGGEPITLAQLDEEASAQLFKLQQQMFDARKAALDTMIDKRLLEVEAASQGMTTEALLAAEVHDKAAEITDAEVDEFYEQNKARMRGDVDKMREPIQKHLIQQQSAELMKTFKKSLRDKAEVKIFMEKVRIVVDPGDSPRHGSADAPIEIIEFSDFQCPYCVRGTDTLNEVKEKYGDKVTVVFRHFPLPMHDRAHRAAEASECANDQGKFWEYHDQLFANQRAMTEENLVIYAENVELNLTAFNECLTSDKHVATVDEDMKDGAAAGMSGTPGFFINGIFLSGAMPIDKFTEVIDAELAKAG